MPRMSFVSGSVLDQCTESERVRREEIGPALLRRAEHLPPEERTLVRSVLRSQQSLRDLAALVGCSPGSLSRRVKKLLVRLCDPMVALLIEGPGGLAAEQQRIGLEHFLLRRSAAQIARAHRMSRARVVSTLDYLRGWSKGISRMGRED